MHANLLANSMNTNFLFTVKAYLNAVDTNSIKLFNLCSFLMSTLNEHKILYALINVINSFVVWLTHLDEQEKNDIQNLFAHQIKANRIISVSKNLFKSNNDLINYQNLFSDRMHINLLLESTSNILKNYSLCLFQEQAG